MARAYAIKYYHEFLTYSENKYRVELLKDQYVGSETSIAKSGGQPVVLRHSGNGKEKWDSTRIRGKELIFNYIVPASEIEAWESEIMESAYRDYKLRFYSYSDDSVPIKVLEFEGFLKPDNFIKSFVNNPNQIQISLSATDALADLRDIEFKEFFGTALALPIRGRFSILQMIKYALENIEIELDFDIQLNTYETTLMSSTENALSKIYVNSEVFFSYVDLKANFAVEDIDSCWVAIGKMLQPFNCKLSQGKGKYKIINYHERVSKTYTFAWSTLAQTAYADSDNILDISDYTYHSPIEHQKVQPIRNLDLSYTFTDDGGSLADDLGDWGALGPWDLTSWFSAVEQPQASDGVKLISRMSDGVSFNYGDTGDYLTLKTDFQATKETTKDYLKLQFEYRINYLTSLILTEIPEMLVRIRMKRPDGSWYPSSNVGFSNPLYGGSYIGSLPGTVTFKSDAKYLSLTNSNWNLFEVKESGAYNFKIEFIPAPYGYPQWYEAEFQVRNVKITKVSSGVINQYKPEITSTDTIKKYRKIGIAGVKLAEEEIFLVDGGQITEKGALLAFPSSEYVNTLAWNRYGVVEALPILDLYGKNFIDNRSAYKNFIRGVTIMDRADTITFENIVNFNKYITDNKDYCFLSYSWDVKREEITADLIELLTVQQTQEDTEQAADDTPVTYFGTVDPDVPLWHVSHGYGIGAALRWDTDFSQYLVAFAVKTPAGVTNPATHVVTEVVNENQYRISKPTNITENNLIIDVDLDDPQVGQFYYLDTNEAGTGKPILLPDTLGDNEFLQRVGQLTKEGFIVDIGEPVPPASLTEHMEKGTLIGTVDFVSHTVNHVFGRAFSNQPLEVLLDVYRMEEQADGTFVKQEVPHGYVDALQPTLVGFDLQINSTFTPDLTGVVIKFKFEKF